MSMIIVLKANIIEIPFQRAFNTTVFTLYNSLLPTQCCNTFPVKGPNIMEVKEEADRVSDTSDIPEMRDSPNKNEDTHTGTGKSYSFRFEQTLL